MNPAAKKIGVVLLKAAIAVISVWFIYRKVNAREDFDQLCTTIGSVMDYPDKRSVLIAVVVLMGVNWLLETAKWKLLLNYIRPSGWLLCLR